MIPAESFLKIYPPMLAEEGKVSKSSTQSGSSSGPGIVLERPVDGEPFRHLFETVTAPFLKKNPDVVLDFVSIKFEIE